MRIIAGQLGSRLFNSPHSFATHPMSDKMRGALFNSLGDITGASVLDAYAGSGALGFEALSRGACNALLIDKDRGAQKIIAENIATLQLSSKAKLVRANVTSWLQTSTDTFDIILLDPPYDKLQPDSLQQLAQRLNAEGTLVLSWPGKQAPLELVGCQFQSSKQYGDASLHFYTAISR